MKQTPASHSEAYSVIPLAQTMVRFCEAKGIKHIVISPGSRNAPLTKGFTNASFFTTYSIVDERAAAFFALGIAQQLQVPTAVVCTSGSALLNYYPAVAEAYYSDIPLVVLSADRMPHRIDIGDGQTIRQEKVFEPHLEDAAYLSPDLVHATATLLAHPTQKLLPKNASQKTIETLQAEVQAKNEKAINRVLNVALTQSGPVHINLPFEEPLYNTTDQPLVLQHCLPTKPTAINEELGDAQKQWHASSKKMVLVGVLPPNSLEEQWIEELAADPSVVVLTETTSNISHTSFVSSIDSLIAPLEKNKAALEALQPDILLSFGGMIVSKKVKAFLRAYAPKQHWHVHPKKAYDTFYCLSTHFVQSPNAFFKTLYAPQKPYVVSDYCASVLQQYHAQRLRGLAYLKTIPFSDLKAFEHIHNALPEGVHLQLANSSTIRYNQLFPLPSLLGVNCNRGTSGIDGSTATAMGAAYTNPATTVFITGDLSFYYDSNGLWHNYLKATTRIIVINNQGGGIFRILPGEKDTQAYDTYFETVQKRSAKALCKMHNIGYQSAQSSLGLRWQLKRFFKPSSRPQLLEIKTPRKINDIVLLDYFRKMNEE